MEKLDNGKYWVNGQEFDGSEYSNLFLGECPCGWSEVNNAMWVQVGFEQHDCLTKAGKPRAKKMQGTIRSATFAEYYEKLGEQQ